jgi:hypothetical protein
MYKVGMHTYIYTYTCIQAQQGAQAMANMTANFGGMVMGMQVTFVKPPW